VSEEFPEPGEDDLFALDDEADFLSDDDLDLDDEPVEDE
jgi:hypothetical protein